MNPVDAAAQAAAASDTTLLSMFWSAHIVVKFVMVGLLLSSFWCWTIIVNKTLLFASFKRSMDRFEQVFWSGQSLEELYGELSTKNNTGVASLFVSAMREWKRSFQNAASSFMGLHARLEKVLDVSIAREVERLESNLCSWRPSPRRDRSSACSARSGAL
jgi:biopolymer transport protein TolQ